MGRSRKSSLPCPYPDCFHCPHPDCIKEQTPRQAPKHRAPAPLRTAEQVARNRAAAREYYRKNKAIINEARRQKRARKREAETSAEK